MTEIAKRASVIAVVNLKGGVGKTTLAVNLAAGLANRSSGERNFTVLLVDLDTQASATAYMLGEQKPDPENNLQAVMGRWLTEKQELIKPANITGRVQMPNPVFRGAWPTLHLLQSYPGDRDVEYGAYAKFARKEDVLQQKKHYRILGYLFEEIIKDYDYILFDCPPHYNWITGGAVLMSDDIIVPVIPDFLSTNGLRDLVLTLAEDIAMLSPDSSKRIRAIALMLSDGNTVHARYTEEVRCRYLPDLQKESRLARELLQDCEIWDGLSRRAAVQKCTQNYEPISSMPADEVPRVELEKMVDSILLWKGQKR